MEVRYPEFGRLVDDKLTRAQLSNAAAAKLMRVTTEMVRRYRGGLAMAEGSNLDKLSKLIGVPVEELLMADRGRAGTKTHAVPSRRMTDDERALLDEFRRLPAGAQRLARARVIELLEEFGAPDPANPFGKGTQ